MVKLAALCTACATFIASANAYNSIAPLLTFPNASTYISNTVIHPRTALPFTIAPSTTPDNTCGLVNCDYTYRSGNATLSKIVANGTAVPIYSFNVSFINVTEIGGYFIDSVGDYTISVQYQLSTLIRIGDAWQEQYWNKNWTASFNVRNISIVNVLGQQPAIYERNDIIQGVSPDAFALQFESTMADNITVVLNVNQTNAYSTESAYSSEVYPNWPDAISNYAQNITLVPGNNIIRIPHLNGGDYLVSVDSTVLSASIPVDQRFDTWSMTPYQPRPYQPQPAVNDKKTNSLSVGAIVGIVLTGVLLCAAGYQGRRVSSDVNTTTQTSGKV